jgi:uncharacterized membrane protein
MFREIQWRTWGKVISWRIILTFVNFTYTYIATGNWKAGLAVAGMAAVFNYIIYWVHERVWNRINWGKTDKETIL